MDKVFTETKWRSVLDEESGKYYFWNIETDEVTWENPFKAKENVPSSNQIKESSQLKEVHNPGMMYKTKNGTKAIDPEQYYSQEVKSKRHLEHFFNYEEYELQRNIESLNKKKTDKHDKHFRKQRDELKRKKILRKYGTDKK
eukprot:NODE_944_length_2958_cov_1.988108.p4 type:complete len:142 gc:universal NODE_944_length_2958_cov_1.988108:710-1135(+)